MKVISFCVKPSIRKTVQRIEYPELDQLIASGFELIDTLPAWGAGHRYVITFMLQPPTARKPRK